MVPGSGYDAMLSSSYILPPVGLIQDSGGGGGRGVRGVVRTGGSIGSRSQMVGGGGQEGSGVAVVVSWSWQW